MFGLFPVIVSLLPFLSWNRAEAEIVFAGDAMQHQAQIDSSKQVDGSHNYDDYFQQLGTYIQNADYGVVNLETPLGGKPYTGYPCFSAPDAYLDALMSAGFDLMLAANNHTLDRRDKGLLRTISQFENREVDYIGIYRNSAHRTEMLPFIKEINGIKIAFLNYTYGTNGIEVRTDVIVDYIDRDKIKRDVEAAREAGAELVTVCVHWGDEYKLLPNQSQKSLAEYLCSLGVDMIIGGHPHVIQPMEMRYSIQHNKNILLVYSLGNFISNMKTRDTRGGAVVKAFVSRNEKGIAQVDSAKYRLVFTAPPHKSKENFRLFPAENYTENAWQSNCQQFIKSAKAIFDKYNRNVPCDTTEIKLLKTKK